MIKVVVADDEAKVAQLICNLVDWQGFDMQIVGVAHNGIEALELVRQHRPDLVVTDIRMPGCDGLSLIQKAKEMQPHLEFIIISGYRHFDYAQSAIKYGVSDYLLKPIKKDELSTTLEKMRWNHMRRTQQLSQQEQLQLRAQGDKERLRNGVFSLLRTQPQEEGITLEQLNRDYYFAMQPGVFQVALLKIDGDYDSMHSEGISVLRGKVEGILAETLAPACYDMQAQFVNTTAQMVLNYAPGTQAEMRKCMRNVLDALRMQNSVFPSAVFTLAQGETLEAPENLAQSMQSAQSTLAQRLLRGAGGLLEPQQGELHAEQDGALLGTGARGLEAAMEVMDPKAVDDVMEEFAQQVLTAKQLSGEDVLYLANEMCSSYLLLARNLGIWLESSGMVYDEFCSRLDLCRDAEEVMQCLAQTVHITFAAALQAKNEEEAKPIRGAKQYIAAHYAEAITLEQVAEQVGFNPSYFSTLFKKETGQTFSEYLQHVRIDKAKEMLRETDWPVARVCEEVGYADLKYFTGVFKKATGIKPGEFRKLYS